MENVKVAFQILTNGEKAPKGSQFINYHMVFNIKIEDVRRKACLVVGVHVTPMLEVITYFTMVTRETVCIALTIHTVLPV